MNNTPKSFTDLADLNLKALKAYWRKMPFHDQLIEDIKPSNRQLVITLEEVSLVLSDVTSFKQRIEELPSSWLYESITTIPNGYSLQVECEGGEFSAEFKNLRLIRRSDMAILIPAIDQ